MVEIRPAIAADSRAWLRMRCALWPDGSDAEHAKDIESYFAGKAREPLAVLIAVDPGGRAVGFAELSIRAQAEGCESERIGYLEGWYVAPEARRRGVARALVLAAESWGRERDCAEFASDTESGNAASVAAHLALGFEDAGVVRCFRKVL